MSAHPIDATGRQITEPLGSPAASYTATATATSAVITLSATARRISIYAASPCRFTIAAAPVATATSHFIAGGERLDFRVTPGQNIAILRASTIDAVVEISELA